MSIINADDIEFGEFWQWNSQFRCSIDGILFLPLWVDAFDTFASLQSLCAYFTSAIDIFVANTCRSTSRNSSVLYKI